jgi:hypothetical protein
MPIDFEGFQPDRDSLAQAESLSERFMSNIRERRPTGMEIRVDFPVRDVVANLDRLAIFLEVSRDLSPGIPCVQIAGEGWIPVEPWSTGSPYGPHSSWPYPPGPDYFLFMRDSWRRWLERMDRTPSEEGAWRFSLVPEEVALASAKGSLKTFLAYRISGFFRFLSPRGPNPSSPTSQFPQGVGPAGSGRGYLSVTVHTANPGLQISSAPAYFITWTYFGAPSTPVTGPLLPGRYFFGGSGSLVPQFTVDPTAFSIPPTLSAVLTAI